jgi:hypothetical protein
MMREHRMESFLKLSGKFPPAKISRNFPSLDPRVDSGSDDVAHDSAQFKAVPWLTKDMHNQKLLEECSIYIEPGQSELQQYMNVDSNAVEHFDIKRYWNDRRAYYSVWRGIFSSSLRRTYFFG